MTIRYFIHLAIGLGKDIGIAFTIPAKAQIDPRASRQRIQIHRLALIG